MSEPPRSEQRSPSSRGEPRWFEPAFVTGLSAFVLCLYVRTAYPDVSGGDSGEIAAAVISGGVIHPPGYPLYSLLGRLFLLLPYGTLAFRLNVFSAVCTALATGLLYTAVRKLNGSRQGAAVAALSFAATPLVWHYAICTEVFALNNLLVASAIVSFVTFDRSRSWLSLLSFAGIFGLAMSNHHMFICTGLPLAAWMMVRGRSQILSPRGLLVGALGLLVGLLPYAILPQLSSHGAAVSWGDERTLSGLLTHVLRREYGTFQLAVQGIAAESHASQTLSAFFTDGVLAPGFWLLPVVAYGVFVLGSSGRRNDGPLTVRALAAAPREWALLVPPLLVALLMATRGNLPVSDGMHRGIVARFWLQPIVYVSLFAGLGWDALSLFAPPPVRTLVALVLTVAPFALRYREMDRHESLLVRTYGAEILRVAPKDALVLTRGDLITNSARYLQTAEGVRPDVRVLDLELLGFGWYADQIRSRYPDVVLPSGRYMPGAPDGFFAKDLLDANRGRGAIVLCGDWKTGDRTVESAYSLFPLGLCGKLSPRDVPLNILLWLDEAEKALPRFEVGPDAHPPGSWDDIVIGDFNSAAEAVPRALVVFAGSDPARQPLIVRAAQLYLDLQAKNPSDRHLRERALELLMGVTPAPGTLQNHLLAASDLLLRAAGPQPEDEKYIVRAAEMRARYALAEPSRLNFAVDAAQTLIDLAGPDPAKRPYLVLASSLLGEALSRTKAPDGRPYKTLATALGRSGLVTPESRAQALAAWRAYLATDPHDEVPSRAAIEAEVARLEAEVPKAE